MPAGKTDQVQPIDDGAGRLYKQYVGQEEDHWLEDDENLQKWENDALMASDRRILLANWYVKAHHRVVESQAVRKYFEHTGGLLTADGTDDNLIKLEGVPKGHTFSWVDDDEQCEFVPLQPPVIPDPTDVCPAREHLTELQPADPRDVLEDDSDDDEPGDDEDEEDAPPAPRTAPEGFEILETPDFPEAVLTPKSLEQEQLVGRSLLYNWPSVGWCVGVVTQANTDKRKTIKIDGKPAMANFFVHYGIDGNTSKHVLELEQYGGEDLGCWVLLKPTE